MRDSSESGVEEVDVDLLDATGGLLASTRTTGSVYRFRAVAVGETYRILFHLPPAHRFTVQDAGDDDTVDSDADATTGETAPFVLEGLADGTIWDAGLIELADSVGDRVWLDENANGRQETDEVGVAGVTVELLDAAGVLLATDITAVDGSYGFHGLIPGSQLVVRVQLPPDWAFTLRDAGPDTTDSDVDRVSGEVAFVLSRAAFATSIDAGLVPPQIGDRVWVDADEDGIQGAGETGRGGVLVELLDAAGAVVDTTVSTSTGGYRFNVERLGGTFRLRFGLPGGHVFSPRDATADHADSDVDASGLSPEFLLDDARDRADWDAGVVPLPTQIGGRVFGDLDENGIDDDESGRGNVDVTLLGAEGQTIDTTRTAADGSYRFVGLLPQSSYRPALFVAARIPVFPTRRR